MTKQSSITPCQRQHQCLNTRTQDLKEFLKHSPPSRLHTLYVPVCIRCLLAVHSFDWSSCMKQDRILLLSKHSYVRLIFRCPSFNIASLDPLLLLQPQNHSLLWVYCLVRVTRRRCYAARQSHTISYHRNWSIYFEYRCHTLLPYPYICTALH